MNSSQTVARPIAFAAAAAECRRSRAEALVAWLIEPVAAAGLVLACWALGEAAAVLAALGAAVAGLVVVERRDHREVEHARRLLRRYLPDVLRRGDGRC